MSDAIEPNQMMTLCITMLHEIGGYPISQERIEQALPLISEMLGHIRRLDQVDLDQIEPAVVFKLKV